MKPDAVRLSTVPAAPPAAGPERALDARPAGVVEEGLAVVGLDVAVAEEDEAQPASSAISAHVDAAPTIHRRLRCKLLMTVFFSHAVL